MQSDDPGRPKKHRIAGGLADSLRAMFVRPPEMSWDGGDPDPRIEGVFDGRDIRLNPYARFYGSTKFLRTREEVPEPLEWERDVLAHEVGHAKRSDQRYHWPTEDLRMGALSRSKDWYARNEVLAGRPEEYDAQAFSNAVHLLQESAGDSPWKPSPRDASLRAAEDSIPGTRSVHDQLLKYEPIYGNHPAKWSPSPGGRETILQRIARSLGAKP